VCVSDEELALYDRDPRICCPGGKGMFLPLFGELFEDDMPDEARAVMYIVGLVYCFIGVAIVADTFMSAIEVITSQTREVWIDLEKVDPESPGARKSAVETADETLVNKYRVKVWNDTVANLTLMALGSSAPEIILSLLELMSNNFFSGRLGPSTIVGSAAFNFLCITSICVSSIPTGEVRKIKDVNVYAITCSASLFAYIWVLLILTVPPSEDRVTMLEGVITFLMFPALVLLSWMADTGFFSKKRDHESHIVGGERDDSIVEGRLSLGGGHHAGPSVVPMSQEQLSKLNLSDAQYKQKLATIRADIQRTQPNVDETTLQRLILKQLMAEEKHSRAHYRVAAIRDMVGGKRIIPNIDAAKIPGDEPAQEERKRPTDLPYAEIEFQAAAYAVLECVDTVRLQVLRLGNTSKEVKVHYRTIDGTATAGEDYIAVDGFLTFAPGVEQMELPVKIIDDVEWEEDEVFYLELELADGITPDVAVLGQIPRTTVTIINDDEPGQLAFEQQIASVKESSRYAEVLVQRHNGSSGAVGCKYRTENKTAIAGADYEEAKGTIKFAHSEMQKTIAIRIYDDQKYDRNEAFKVVLYDVFGGVQLDPANLTKEEGGGTSLSCEVRIQSDAVVMNKVDVLADWLHSNADKHRLGTSNWYDQFVEALCVNGSVEDAEEATALDIGMHAVCLPWKLMNALVPPTDFADGWLCFIFSLVLIGLVTGLVGDLASLAGCVLNIPDEITAITLVALGTSVPDTFASKTAAVQDQYADASIGNVTGSNAVNVFLGLGMPWTIGAVYWKMNWDDPVLRKTWLNREIGFTGVTYLDAGYLEKYPDGAFIVPAQDLGFSVMVYSICACFAIVLLCSRRITAGGELGGPHKVGKIRTAAILFGLWIAYITISSVKIMANARESGAV
jgi:solute carrier family 8 (sodium/calcium exchanger)